jgi:ParB-like chromosome segregation protein Spo0J
VTTEVQLFPPLDQATESALRASIQRFGVLVPVVRDQTGRVLDGHHRVRLAEELGVSYEAHVREVADDDEAQEIARTLNADRRHLTEEQRRPVVKALAEEGHSRRAIGRALGVSHDTVRRDLQSQVDDAVHLPERVEGQDGKSYPVRKPKSERAPSKRRQGARDRSKPYEPTTAKQQQRASAQRQRLITGLSEIRGICRGLITDIDYRMAASVWSSSEIEEWAGIAGEISNTIRTIKTKLLEVTSDAREAPEDDSD